MYTASDTTWEIIFRKRPRIKWCRTNILEYKQQLEKIFGGRAASSNDVFDLRLIANTGEQDTEENAQGDSSFLGRIDNEFGPLSEGEEPVRITDNGPPTKKVKLHHNADTLSKEPCQSGDETPSQPRIIKKKSAGFTLANQMKKWREHREKEYEQRELAKLSLEAQVIRSIQDNYAEEVEKLLYKEYAQLVLLLRQSHEEFGGYTGAEYYTMMDGRSFKFRNELIKKWFEKSNLN